MTTHVINWPKLIGAFVVTLGIAYSLKGWDVVSYMTMSEPFATVDRYVWLVVAVGSVASVIVGFAAYSGREWARRTLVGVTAVAIVLCINWAYFDVTRSISTLGGLTPQLILWSCLLFFAEALQLVSPPLFFLLILLHPDVVRSFRPAATLTI